MENIDRIREQNVRDHETRVDLASLAGRAETKIGSMSDQIADQQSRMSKSETAAAAQSEKIERLEKELNQSRLQSQRNEHQMSELRDTVVQLKAAVEEFAGSKGKKIDQHEDEICRVRELIIQQLGRDDSQKKIMSQLEQRINTNHSDVGELKIDMGVQKAALEHSKTFHDIASGILRDNDKKHAIMETKSKTIHDAMSSIESKLHEIEKSAQAESSKLIQENAGWKEKVIVLQKEIQSLSQAFSSLQTGSSASQQHITHLSEKLQAVQSMANSSMGTSQALQDAKGKLEEAVENLKREHNTLAKSVKLVQHEYHNVQKEVCVQSEKMSTSGQAISTIRAELGKLGQENLQKTERIWNIEKLINDNSKLIDSFCEDYKNLKSSGLAVEEKVKSLEAGALAASKVSQKLQVENEITLNHFQEVHIQLKELEDKLHCDVEKVGADLRDELQPVQGGLDQNKEEISKIIQQLKEVQEKSYLMQNDFEVKFQAVVESLEFLKKKSEDMNQEYQSLQDTVESMSHIQSDTKSELQGLVQGHLNLKEMVQGISEQNSDFKADLTALMVNQDEMKLVSNGLKDELISHQGVFRVDIEQLQTKTASLQSSLDCGNAERVKVAESVQAIRKQCQDMQFAISGLKGMSDELTEKMKPLTKQSSDFQVKLQSLKEMHESLESSVSIIEAKAQGRTEDIRTLFEQFNSLDEQSKLLKKTLTKMFADNAEFKLHVQGLQDQHKSMKSKHAEMKKENVSLKEQVQSLNMTTSLMIADSNKLLQENANWMLKTQAVDTLVESLSFKSEAIVSDLERMQQENNSLKQLIRSLEEMYESLEKASEGQKMENEHLEKRIDVNEQMLAVYDSNLAEMGREWDRVSEQSEQLKKKMNEFLNKVYFKKK